jgi:hypothetical protein
VVDKDPLRHLKKNRGIPNEAEPSDHIPVAFDYAVNFLFF